MSAARRRRGSPTARFGGGEAGQGAVELVGLLPVLLAAALAVGQLFASGGAREAAAAAAAAGAAALTQAADADAVVAARAAVPTWPARRLRVRVTGRTVRVTALPRRIVPAPARLLDATSVAVAGTVP